MSIFRSPLYLTLRPWFLWPIITTSRSWWMRLLRNVISVSAPVGGLAFRSLFPGRPVWHWVVLRVSELEVTSANH